jgi:hypothetical protein
MVKNRVPGREQLAVSSHFDHRRRTTMIRRILKAAALVWIAKKVAGYAERRERRKAVRRPIPRKG